MRLIKALVATMLTASPAFAAPPGERPMERREAVERAVTQPLSDVNIKRRDIPPALIAIRDNPYSLEGIASCNDLIDAIRQLDAVLGADFDQVSFADRAQKRRETASGLAGGIVSSLIPFRALVREVSGANKSENEFRAAIYAGVVRRGFLKGYGQMRRCKPPGRPLTEREQASQAATIIATDAALLSEEDDK